MEAMERTSLGCLISSTLRAPLSSKDVLRGACVWLAGLSALAGSFAQSAARAAEESPPAATRPPVLRLGEGRLIELSVFPTAIRIPGRGETLQLVVTGHYENAGVCDLTTHALEGRSWSR
jgi:hypothetical protein